MKENQSKNTGGIGFLGLLALIFITLKLTRVIDWSWWWVLSPIWIPTVIALLIIVIVLIGASTAAAVKESKKQNRRSSK